MLTRSNTRTTLSILLIIAAELAGCATTQVSTRKGWDEFKEVYAVKGRQDFTRTRTMGFGPYRSSAVRLNAPGAGNGWEVIPLGNKSATAPKLKDLSFRMSGNRGASASLYCVNRIPLRRFAGQAEQPQYYDLMKPLVSDIYQGEIFATEILQEGNDDNWKMMIASNIILSRNKRIAGYLLRDPDNFYAILPLFTRDNSSKGAKSWKLSGYEFKNRANQLVAAISLHNKTSVTLAHLSESEKFLLANACAAILINHFTQLHLQAAE